MKTPILQTERLILRPVTLDDAPAVQKYFHDWDIIKYMDVKVPWPYPDDGALMHIRDNVLPKMENGAWLIWAIIRKESGDLVGMIDFRFVQTEDGHRGFWIAKPYWGRGYITETVCAVNDFVFNELSVKSFITLNAKSNTASRRVKEKTGAIFVCEQEGNYHCGDKISEVWKMTKESWDDTKQRSSLHALCVQSIDYTDDAV